MEVTSRGGCSVVPESAANSMRRPLPLPSRPGGAPAAAVVGACFVVCFALAVLGYDPQRGMIGRVQRPA